MSEPDVRFMILTETDAAILVEIAHKTELGEKYHHRMAGIISDALARGKEHSALFAALERRQAEDAVG